MKINLNLRRKKPSKKIAKLLIALFSGLLALSLTAVVFTYQLPIELEVKRNIASYEQKAYYTCIANLHPNMVYEDTALLLKDKAFLRLVRNVNVTLTFNFKSSPPSENTSITYELNLVVESPGLWSKRFTIQEPIKLNAASFMRNMSLSMAWVDSLISNITREIGIHSSRFNVLITANINLSAFLAGRNITKQFSPTLELSLDYGSGIMTVSGLSHEDSSTITEASTREAYIQAFGAMIKVSDARTMSQSLSIASVIALGLILFATRPAHGELKEVNSLLKKYDDMIIDVETPPNAPKLIRVKSLKGLFKIAQGLEKPVLHVSKSEMHGFYVLSAHEAYFYTVESPKLESNEESNEV